MPSLKYIATIMIAKARRKGWASHDLAQGLRLFLKQNHARLFHLTVSRDGQSPSPHEIEIISRDFGLPPDTHEYVTYHLTWPDSISRQSSDPKQAPK